MTITTLSINDFRNIEKVELTFSEDINLICGSNGSGKTSILEAIYFLGRGKSFRTQKNNLLIELAKPNFILFGKTVNNFKVGIRKSRNQKLDIKVNEEKLTQLSSLSSILAIQIITPDSYQLIESGPSIRRKFIDWIVFHVKHDLINVWKNHRKILLQRNNALKKNLPLNQITIWDKELVNLSNILTEERINYIREINKELAFYNKTIFENKLNIKLIYLKGWNDSLGLGQVLKNNISFDIKRGHTSFGMNKSEIKIMVKFQDSEIEAKEFLSKGNKKLLSILLIIIQTKILIKEKKFNIGNIKPILLMDDLYSELDKENFNKIYRIICSLNIQSFFTGIDLPYFLDNQNTNEKFLKKEKPIKVFHVKHGLVSEKSPDDI